MDYKVYVWVHTCPQRVDHIDKLKESLESSDVEEYAVECHEPGLDWSKIMEWWLERWRWSAKQAKEIGATHVLRIEDDTVVNQHLIHNITTWPALGMKDFGVGLLFIDRSLLVQLGGFGVEPETGVMRVTMDHLACGQAQLLPVDLVDKIAGQYAAATAALRHREQTKKEDFDCSITHGAYRLGYRTYVHVPNLVQTSQLSQQSILSDSSVQAHSSPLYDPKWKRPAGRLRDIEAEHIWGYETRWTVLNFGTCGEVAQVRTPPRPQGSVQVTWQGRSLIMHSDNLFVRQEEAEAALRERFPSR